MTNCAETLVFLKDYLVKDYFQDQGVEHEGVKLNCVRPLKWSGPWSRPPFT